MKQREVTIFTSLLKREEIMPRKLTQGQVQLIPEIKRVACVAHRLPRERGAKVKAAGYCLWANDGQQCPKLRITWRIPSHRPALARA